MDTLTNLKRIRIAYCTGHKCPIKDNCKKYNLKAFGNPAGKYWMSAMNEGSECKAFEKKRLPQIKISNHDQGTNIQTV